MVAAAGNVDRYLKLDVEGHEPIVLRSMIKACTARPTLWPRAILFEHKHVRGWKQLVDDLQAHGYTVISYTNTEHKDTVLARIGDGAIKTDGLAKDPSLSG